MGGNRPWSTPTSASNLPPMHPIGPTKPGIVGACRGHPCSPRLDSRQTVPGLANQLSHIKCVMPTVGLVHVIPNSLGTSWPNPVPSFQMRQSTFSRPPPTAQVPLVSPQQKPAKAFSWSLLQMFYGLTSLRGFQHSSFQ